MGATPRLRAATRAALLLAVLAACNDGVDKDEPSQDKVDTGGDADADVDTDADSDSDTDTDTDPVTDVAEGPCPGIEGLDRDNEVWIAETAFSTRAGGADGAFNTAFVGGRDHHYAVLPNVDGVLTDIVLTLDQEVWVGKGEWPNDFAPAGLVGTVYCSADPDDPACAGEDFASAEMKSVNVPEAAWAPPGVAPPPTFTGGCYSATIAPARLDGTISAFFLFADSFPDDDTTGHEEMDIAEIYGLCDEADGTDECQDFWLHLPYFDETGAAMPPDRSLDLEGLDVWDPGDPPPRFDMLWEPGASIRWWVNGVEVTHQFYDTGPILAADVASEPLPAFVNLWAVDNDGEGGKPGWAPPNGDCSLVPGCTPSSNPILDEDGDAITSASAIFENVQWIPFAGETEEASLEEPAPESRCQEGSGSFLLVRRDSGAGRAARCRPIQVAGTGVLSDDASIVRARAWGPSGAMVVARDRSRRPVRIGRGWAGFAQGRLPGSTAFELPGSRSALVELSWSCPADVLPFGMWSQSAMSLDALAPELETFRLADVGCPVDWPQPFVLGVDVAVAEPAVWIGTYGSPASRRYAPLVWGANGARSDFRFEEAGLVVAGRVLAHDGRRATLSLDEVSWRGVGLCEPGVYGVPLARAADTDASRRRSGPRTQSVDGKVSDE